MLKVTAGASLIFGAAYFALPGAQTLFLASAPFLLALICPISLVVMMLMMKGSSDGKRNESASTSAALKHKTSDDHYGAPGQV